MKLSKKLGWDERLGWYVSQQSQQALTDKAQSDLVSQGSIARIKNHMWDKIQVPI
jgi:hypothetical protein